MIEMRDLKRAAEVMSGFDPPWWFAGGWAIELFVGRRLREHEDLEIGLLRKDQHALRRHLAGWEWCKAIQVDDHGEWIPWPSDERLDLPIFQLKTNREREEVEFMLNDASDGLLQFRREPSITRPMERAVGRSRAGLPYLAPELQLLYKAKWHRDKDESDFTAATEAMSAEQRVWLKASLQRWNASDPWIARL